MLRFPAESVVKFVFAGDQNGRIAGAAGREFAGDFATGDALGGVENFQDGETAAVADVESLAGNAIEGFESAEVGIGDVHDVDVVADAGAVGRRVIGAKDFDVRNRARGGIEYARDEMSFDAMVLAAVGGCTRGVEIAEDRVVEAGIGAIVGKDFLEADFGFAVGIDGIFGVVLGYGDNARLAVSGGGGGEDQFSHAVTNHGVEEMDAGRDVGGVKGARFADGLGDKSFSSKMHHSVELVLGKNLVDLRTHTQIGAAESSLRRNGGEMALLKIIERDHPVAAGEQDF